MREALVGKAATDLVIWDGFWGQNCSLCVPHPVQPRPCAVWATAVSAAWAMKGMAVCAQVSRELLVGGPGPTLRAWLNYTFLAPSGRSVPEGAWRLQ